MRVFVSRVLFVTPITINDSEDNCKTVMKAFLLFMSISGLVRTASFLFTNPDGLRETIVLFKCNFDGKQIHL